MSIQQILRNRRAVRSCKAQEVETEKISALLEAAVWAPNDRQRLAIPGKRRF